MVKIMRSYIKKTYRLKNMCSFKNLTIILDTPLFATIVSGRLIHYNIFKGKLDIARIK